MTLADVSWVTAVFDEPFAINLLIWLLPNLLSHNRDLHFTRAPGLSSFYPLLLSYSVLAGDKRGKRKKKRKVGNSSVRRRKTARSFRQSVSPTSMRVMSIFCLRKRSEDDNNDQGCYDATV
jgi:hypothetical protein